MRGRKARLLEGIENYNFDKLSRSRGNNRERRRYLAFAHIREGKSFTETAERVRVDLRTLMNWVERFRKRGIEGLKDKYGGGAKPHIRASEYEAFRKSVLDLQKGRLGGRIRGADIQNLIESQYGTRPAKSTVYDILKRAGLVWITGRSRHPKSDKQAQEAFKKAS